MSLIQSGGSCGSGGLLFTQTLVVNMHPSLPKAAAECLVTPAQDDTLNIVLEYAPHGDLSNLIQERAAAQKPFTEDEIMFW